MEKLELIDEKEIAARIERYIQSGHVNFLIGSGASIPAISLAGNIEAEIDTQLELGQESEANKIALDFIEELEHQHSFLPDGYTAGDDTDITLKNYVNFMRSLDRILFERKNILLPRQASIFTTNYDEFFETASALLPSMVLHDGFDRRVGASKFIFAPEIFFDRVYRSGAVYENQSEMPAVNLVKMHGSLSWRRGTDETISYGSDAIPGLTTVQKENPDDVKAALSKRAVILPNMRKFESTLLDRVYFDLLRIYSNTMEKENSLLFVFGFSFADGHILDITRRALRNPTAKIIVFAYSPGDVVEFERKFSAHRNVTVIAPVGGEVIDFQRMNAVLEKIGSNNEPVVA